MNSNSQWRSRFAAAAGLFLFTSPAFAYLGVWLFPAAPVMLMLLPAVSSGITLIIRRLPQKRRFAWLAVSLFIMALACTGLMRSLDWRLIFPFAAAGFIMPVLLTALSHPPGREWNASFLYVGIGVHLISQIFLNIESLKPAKAMLSVLFIVYFFYFIFALNQINVQDGIGEARRTSGLALARNRKFVCLAGVLVIIISNAAVIKNTAMAVFAYIKQILAAAAAWFLGLFSTSEMPVPQTVPDAAEYGEIAEAGEPGLFAVILEKVLMVLAFLALLLLSVYVLYRAYTLVRKAVKALMQRLRLYVKHVGESYEDTIESLLDWGEAARVFREKGRKLFLRREKQLPWGMLSNRECVRRVFHHLKRAHPDAAESKTARELLVSGALEVDQSATARIADIYDQARYSQSEISSEEMEYVRKTAKV